MRASSSQQDYQAQPPQTNQAEEAAAELPGFRPVNRWPGPASRDQPSPQQALTAPAAGAAGSDSGSSGPDPRTPTDDDRHPPRPFSAGLASSFEQIAAGALKAVGGLLNQRLGADDNDESWLPDDDDEETIAPPVGRLMARRLPLGDKGDLTELEDIGAALVGLVAYGLKGVTGMWQARRERRRAKKPLQQSGAVVYQGGPGDGAGGQEQEAS